MAYKNYKIRDNWLDIDKYNDVDIQSVNGVIQTIKVNGQDAGGGSSDFSTATVTYTKNPSHQLELAVILDDEIWLSNSQGTVPAGTYTFILYKGKAFLRGFEADFLNMDGNSTSGAIAFDSANQQYIITGDFTYNEP